MDYNKFDYINTLTIPIFLNEKRKKKHLTIPKPKFKM